MVVIIEPKFPIRGILSKPIDKPTRLDLTEAQVKRCILNGAKVYYEQPDGKKLELTASNAFPNMDKVPEQPATITAPTPAETEEGAASPEEQEKGNWDILKQVAGAISEDIKEHTTRFATTPAEPVVETEETPSEQPAKHMTKAERRKARKEAARKAAEESVETTTEEEPAVVETEISSEERKLKFAIESLRKESQATYVITQEAYDAYTGDIKEGKPVPDFMAKEGVLLVIVPAGWSEEQRNEVIENVNTIGRKHMEAANNAQYKPGTYSKEIRLYAKRLANCTNSEEKSDAE